ncbi:MAG: CPBP family intramembrane metalloprotease [Muribaculaceae bacterium]|nr:CPBP family intramembrane metalloprotease [Muribaculaceae bacterium]
MRFTVTLPKRLLMLLFTFIIGYVLVAVIAFIIQKIAGPESVPGLRILMVMQDLFMFIAPAVLTAVIITRQPAELMLLDRRPFWPGLIMGLCVMVAAIPAMNLIIHLNESIPLPEPIEQVLRQMEDTAAGTIETLYAGHTVGSLVMGMLIVAILAGLSEEILFRGALQRILSTGGLNTHTAIWITAAVFSLMHLQFYGLIPRMLLGAFFGYMLWWSRSLWAPIILHAFNNAIYVVAQWFANGEEESALDALGTTVSLSDIIIVCVSVALTVLGIIIARRNFSKIDNLSI